MDASEAHARFDEILDEVKNQPTAIRRLGEEIAIVLSMAEYERLRGATIREFLALRDDIAREASAADLSEDRLSELLNDD